MKRRELAALAVASGVAWPFRVRAQQNTLRRVGMLLGPEGREAFPRAMRDLGWVENRDITFEFRPFTPPEKLSDFVADLITAKVEVIVAAGSQSVRAAQRATRSIPIVMAPASDPVGTGFVASLARPGGNITGLSLISTDLSGKRLELLREAVAGLSTLAVLWTPDDPPAALALKETEDAAGKLGIALWVSPARDLGELDGAFSQAAEHGARAIIVLNSTFNNLNAGRIAELAIRHRLPSIGITSNMTKRGVLLSYGPSIPALVIRAASYVDKILKGAKASDLPVEQPTKLELIVNLKTAKALDLTISPLILARADEVIE